jgi:ribonuclease PH
MRFTIFQDSKVGDRSGNEDRVGYSYSRDVLLMVIADGMGGHQQGEVAAEIAVTEITRRFQQEARNKLRKPFDFLVSAIQSAHRAIVSHAVAHNMLECPRTTIVACIVQHGNTTSARRRFAPLLRRHTRRGHAGPLARADDRRGRDHGEMAARHPSATRSSLGGVVPPQISTSKEFRSSWRTIVLSPTALGADAREFPGNMVAKRALVQVMPGLLSEAHRRAKGESDNLSVIAMTWEDQDDKRVADTANLDDEEFASSSNTTEQLEGGDAPVDDVTDEDIERAITEIQTAIRKVPRDATSERGPGDLRPLRLIRKYTKHPEGSVLVAMEHAGAVHCERRGRVPPFLRRGSGWVTAEDASARANTRGRRRASRRKRGARRDPAVDRPQPARRDGSLRIGRAPGTSITDVLRADGGTRCASITGAMVAMADAFAQLRPQSGTWGDPIRDFVGAVPSASRGRRCSNSTTARTPAATDT